MDVIYATFPKFQAYSDRIGRTPPGNGTYRVKLRERRRKGEIAIDSVKEIDVGIGRASREKNLINLSKMEDFPYLPILQLIST